MSTARKARRVLVIDDEPWELEWLLEFLTVEGHVPEAVASIEDALPKVMERPLVYDLITVDLSMPLPRSQQAQASSQGALYEQFPGLFVALMARNSGYTRGEIIAYSVHDKPEIEAEASRIGVRYCVKGRPRELKAQIKKFMEHLDTKESRPLTKGAVRANDALRASTPARPIAGIPGGPRRGPRGKTKQ